eukprot:TRINITY_DN9399_c0_g1_i1.p1 TRINITY_DN9399_c0_g1~~TRINITY_DN9399_c0_g1_i1.p1  ORF type:complete len:136 (+),score=21.17 TRINITY_DN9399_c0_g1_i1:73-480(+)
MSSGSVMRLDTLDEHELRQKSTSLLASGADARSSVSDTNVLPEWVAAFYSGKLAHPALPNYPSKIPLEVSFDVPARTGCWSIFGQVESIKAQLLGGKHIAISTDVHETGFNTRESDRVIHGGTPVENMIFIFSLQ